MPDGHQQGVHPERKHGRRRLALGGALCILLLALFVGWTLYEVHTSALQAWLFPKVAARLSYQLEQGPSPSIAFPEGGPFNVRRGYTRIPAFQNRLEESGYEVVQQARQSPALVRLVNWGIAPPYSEPVETGLTVLDVNGEPIYQPLLKQLVFRSYAELPLLLVRTLLFIENRELEKPSTPQSNPAIEWQRLVKASLLYASGTLGLTVPVQGGSTLAIQLEKYRHSPNGRTNSLLDKLQQIVGASLKAYRDGPDTRSRRREIILDYVNTVPLAAAPGYGEVHGLAQGLYVWFGSTPDQLKMALTSPETTSLKARAYKQLLALLVALPAPSRYLLQDRPALYDRVDSFMNLLENAQIVDEDFALAVKAEPIRFLSAPSEPFKPRNFGEKKATNAIRVSLAKLLGVPSAYELDRLQLEALTTIDSLLQQKTMDLFKKLTDPEFVTTHGLMEEKLLRGSDLHKITYSLMLFERSPEGNVLRVHADNLQQPFDINQGGKLELGSTAKLRTVAHYLELVALLYRELSPLDPGVLAEKVGATRDPITRWATETLQRDEELHLDTFVDLALGRRYSASPHEIFFTGGGTHRFSNFDSKDNSRVASVREAMEQSINLVFIRLMRDLVSYHKARLPYNAEDVLSSPGNPERLSLLEATADEEATATLSRAYRRYRGLSKGSILQRLLGKKEQSPRHLAILFFAWGEGKDEEALAAWLGEFTQDASPAQVRRLWRAYSNERLSIADYGYLLSRNPLEVWVAGRLWNNPEASWHDVFAQSAVVRRQASAWLFKAKNRRAQNLRLRIRVEKDAFDHMTPYWKRLGFPFKTLVPSYATAIGSSSDRPVALAELMGILVNDGLWQPAVSLKELHFARATPYETLFEPKPQSGVQVMEPTVARAIKGVLSGVVESGTARRVRRAFIGSEGAPVVVGGKTGSGDNRVKTFNRQGGLISSRVVNRTATFVFYISDRYFGVVTASVPDADAAKYHFTSALPVTVLKLLAPVINEKLALPVVEPVQARR